MFHFTLALLLFLAAGFNSSDAALIHRYKLNDNANDSVGSAHGTPVGDATFTGSKAVLSGKGYITLPSGVISSVTNATFETWTTWYGGANWQLIFDFLHGCACG